MTPKQLIDVDKKIQEFMGVYPEQGKWRIERHPASTWLRTLLSTANTEHERVLREIMGRIALVEEDRKYKAMVANGDLSFINYTPTEIYSKGLDTAFEIVKEYIQ